MTFHFASVHFAAEPDGSGYQWPAAALESFLRQNAAREDLAFTRYMLDAYQNWQNVVDRHIAKGSESAIADNPFDAFFHVSDVTMRGFLRLLSHRISFATAMVLTGMERAEVEALANHLRAWLAATRPAQGLHQRIQLGFDPHAAELRCPCCTNRDAPVFFGLSWHHIQVYRCDACGHLFEAHQGLRDDGIAVPGNDLPSHSHV